MKNYFVQSANAAVAMERLGLEPVLGSRTTPDDPAYWMLESEHTSSTDVYNAHCYICRDPEFAQMGLPLCFACPLCGAHTPADDVDCDNGHDVQGLYMAPEGELSARSERKVIV